MQKIIPPIIYIEGADVIIKDSIEKAEKYFEGELDKKAVMFDSEGKSLATRPKNVNRWYGPVDIFVVESQEFNRSGNLEPCLRRALKLRGFIIEELNSFDNSKLLELIRQDNRSRKLISPFQLIKNILSKKK